MSTPFVYLLVVAIGIVIGVSELFTRYKDEPIASIQGPGFLYILLNALSPAIAYYLTGVYKMPDTTGISASAAQVNHILLSSIGSMAFLRSSLFNLRVGTQDVSIGPASILQALFDTADRAVDRERAGKRSSAVQEIMKNVSFTKAQATLPTYCQALMQNLSSDDQIQLGRQISTLIGTTNMSESAKAAILGLMLMNLVGEDVLRTAVNGLGSEITNDPQTPPKLSTQNPTS